ncbi:dimethylaniline monooxygenase [N-oxide-forming] 2-like isoform X2 [Betta splendens]|nr:dimethylaniline monooxygenase [N-oxide-forming] 2-like isoform X2 [Betta splendens]
MAGRVAVVGAGSSGLVCIKTCLEEGLQPVCFESSDDIGGLWRFKESPEPERSSIYRSLVTNTSKEMICFSDFPMPAEYPNYTHNSQLLQYLRLYAEHFDLLPYIHFQTTVRSVTQRPDFAQSGQWDVVTVSNDGKEERHVFGAVLVCSGHYTHPDLPLSDFPGYETFSGRCFHSWEYKDADACKGKRVVVVGIGNSGGDIAVEISRSAEKTFLSIRQGGWVIGRMSTYGLPMDMIALTRFNSIIMQLLPHQLVNWAIERALNQKCDHRLYGLKPTYRFLDGRVVINDDLPGRIFHGAVVVKAHLKGFTDSGVVFEDGTVEDDIDAVVFSTGYKACFPFLPKALTGGPHGELTLYKRLFPPSLQCHTLAIISLIQAKGPIMPMAEMQARWAVRVFKGLCRLPSKEKMLSVVESDMKKNLKSHACPRVAALQVNYIPYLDFVAKQVGVRPNLLTLLWRDPVLWVKVFFGPCTSYQYRLTGPGQWAGARHAILTQWERVARPFRTRPLPEPETRPSAIFSPWLVTFGAAAAIALLLCKKEILPVLQGAAQIVDRTKVFLTDCCSSV